MSITLTMFVLFAALCWTRYIIVPPPLAMTGSGGAPFGLLLDKWLGANTYGQMAVSVFFMLATAFVLTRVISRNLVFPARTTIFVILYAIAGFGLFIIPAPAPAVICGYVLVKATEYYTRAFRRAPGYGLCFWGSFLLGAAPLIYAPSVIYTILFPAAMFILMRSARETIVGFTGLVLPILGYSYLIWGLGGNFKQPVSDLYDAVTSGTGNFFPFTITDISGLLTTVTAGLLVISVLLSLATVMAGAGAMRTRAFRIYGYFTLFLLVAIAGTLMPCSSVADYPIMAIPVCVTASAFFSRHQGKIPAIIFLLIIGCAAAANAITLAL